MTEIYNIITADDFPEDQIHFNDEFHYAGREYHAFGYAIVNGKGYSFQWNEEWGIRERSIEEDKDAFMYVKEVPKHD